MRYAYARPEDFAAFRGAIGQDDSLLVVAGATLSPASDGTSGPSLLNVSGMIQNDGSILFNAAAPQTDILVGLFTGATLFNNGVIDTTSTRTSNFTGAVFTSPYGSNGDRTTIVNNGTIIGRGTANGIEARDGAIIMNYGTITSDRNAINSRPRSEQTTGVSISNFGTINGSVSLVNSFDNIVSNAGAMNGMIVLGDGNDTLVNSTTLGGDVDLGGGNNTLANRGTMSGRLSFGAGTTTIGNTGTITTDLVFGGSSTVANAGMISGNVSFGSGGDKLVDSGTIHGNVNLGGGNDVADLTFGTVDGTLDGGQGADTILGGSAGDRIYGDNVSGDTAGGNDVVSGGFGDDLLYGGYGSDTLYGNQGNDLMYGNQGNDWMHGGSGDDSLFGGQGNDVVNGGVGNDTLAGNLGDDTFVISPNFGRDAISDLSAVAGNTDVIQFQPGTFTSFADVQAHATQQGADTVIALDAANAVTLRGITATTLTANQFIFG